MRLKENTAQGHFYLIVLFFHESCISESHAFSNLNFLVFGFFSFLVVFFSNEDPIEKDRKNVKKIKQKNHEEEIHDLICNA